MTLKRIVQKLGAKAKANIPIMLLVKPIGKAKGVGFLSVYVPIIGCITEAIIFKVKAIKLKSIGQKLYAKSNENIPIMLFIKQINNAKGVCFYLVYVQKISFIT